jgi:ankyrin repeat protein
MEEKTMKTIKILVTALTLSALTNFTAQAMELPSTVHAKIISLLDEKKLAKEFFVAIATDNTEKVQELLAKVNLHILNDEGQTPFEAAAFSSKPAIVSLFLKDPRVNNSKAKSIALYHAVCGNNKNVVTLLLTEKDIQIDIQDNKSMTILQAAIVRGNETIIKALLDYKKPGIIDQSDIKNQKSDPLLTYLLNLNKNKTSYFYFLQRELIPLITQYQETFGITKEHIQAAVYGKRTKKIIDTALKDRKKYEEDKSGCIIS